MFRERIEYPEDCVRLKEKIFKETRYDLTLNEVQEFWRWNSKRVCAGWLKLSYEIDGETLEELIADWVHALRFGYI